MNTMPILRPGAARLVEQHPSAILAVPRKNWHTALGRTAAGDVWACQLLPTLQYLYLEALRMSLGEGREYLVAALKVCDEYESALKVLADKIPQLDRARLLKQLFGAG